jgi:hypothetical protein
MFRHSVMVSFKGNLPVGSKSHPCYSLVSFGPCKGRSPPHRALFTITYKVMNPLL